MRSVLLKRPNEKFNKNINYTIKDSNGYKIDTLANNSSEAFEIADDITYIQVKMFWVGTKKILLPNTTSKFEFIITGNRFFNQYLPLTGAVIGLIGILNNTNFLSKTSAMVLGILFISVLLGSITVWKNDWLHYQENK